MRGFNAAYGFAKGDQALQAFARLLGDAAQEIPDCKLSRYGGDTFLLVQKNGYLTDIQILAERLRKTWRKTAAPLTATFAVGELGADLAAVTASCVHLENALYQAKEQGADRVAKALS
jgi:diguanylate cyclase (GGDEF)-like protein